MHDHINGQLLHTNGQFSGCKELNCGIPRGSVLGSVLLNMFNDYLEKESK